MAKAKQNEILLDPAKAKFRLAKLKIIQDRNKCIGCGSCAAICPANWFMDDDGKSTPKKTIIEKEGCNKDAAEACPVQAIKIVKLIEKFN